MRNWLQVAAFYYPGHLAASLLIITVPSLLLNLYTGKAAGSWEIQPLGIMPQSALVNELFSSSPAEVLVIAAVLLGMLAAVAALVRRWSVTGATVLLAAGGILVLPYWVFAFRGSEPERVDARTRLKILLEHSKERFPEARPRGNVWQIREGQG